MGRYTYKTRYSQHFENIINSATVIQAIPLLRFRKENGEQSFNSTLESRSCKSKFLKKLRHALSNNTNPVD